MTNPILTPRLFVSVLNPWRYVIYGGPVTRSFSVLMLIFGWFGRFGHSLVNGEFRLDNQNGQTVGIGYTIRTP